MTATLQQISRIIWEADPLGLNHVIIDFDGKDIDASPPKNHWDYEAEKIYALGLPTNFEKVYSVFDKMFNWVSKWEPETNTFGPSHRSENPLIPRDTPWIREIVHKINQL